LRAVTRCIELKHAPPNDKLYGNPIFGIQVTGNSNSIVVADR
jgi:isoquinoline 1-oxidoreductase subunit beta